MLLTRALEEGVFGNSHLNLVDVVVWDNEKALLVAVISIGGTTSLSSRYTFTHLSQQSHSVSSAGVLRGTVTQGF